MSDATNRARAQRWFETLIDTIGSPPPLNAGSLMALADSEAAELRARVEKAESARGELLERERDLLNEIHDLWADRDRLRDGIQALADEWEGGVTTPGLRHDHSAARLRGLLSPTTDEPRP